MYIVYCAYTGSSSAAHVRWAKTVVHVTSRDRPDIRRESRVFFFVSCVKLSWVPASSKRSHWHRLVCSFAKSIVYLMIIFHIFYTIIHALFQSSFSVATSFVVCLFIAISNHLPSFALVTYYRQTLRRLSTTCEDNILRFVWWRMFLSCYRYLGDGDTNRREILHDDTYRSRNDLHFRGGIPKGSPKS